MNHIEILIGCERSGIVRDKFRAIGRDAWSCDLAECEGDQTHHIKGDMFEAIAEYRPRILIAHPPCTYLSSSGLHWNKRTPGREEKTEDALRFAEKTLRADVEIVVVENPIGCISTRLRHVLLELGYDWQTIQPHQHGEDASKATVLFLKGAPRIEPTKHVPPRWVCCGKVLPDGVGKYGCPNCLGEKRPLPRWGNQTDSGQNRLGPSETRAIDRARTYPGIADAMVKYWGHL